MRSKSKPAAARLLIVVGRGLAAGFAPDLVWHFQQGGFEIRIALAPEAEGWAAPEALRALSGAPVLFHEPHPAWAERTDVFAATVAIGLPPATLSDLTRGVARTPAIDLMLRRGGALFLLHETLPESGEPIARECAALGHTLVELPQHPGMWRKTFERLLSDVVLLLSRRESLAAFPVAVTRTVPAPLATLAGDAPAWLAELRRQLRRLGFPTSEKAPMLHIETYEGPFPLPAKKGRSSALSVTLDPTASETVPPAPPGAFHVRFVHPDAPETAVKTLAATGTLVVRRQPLGHLIVTDGSGDRLLPDVTAQPAFLRLAELLADRRSQPAG
ncbi:MAG TPA: hypothetical protein PLU72_06655 [Candidatus Ozemobacteraceae bacterium]|nr:hypothetical protein [Candidatus Ozemobacteraceae bacterium]